MNVAPFVGSKFTKREKFIGRERWREEGSRLGRREGNLRTLRPPHSALRHASAAAVIRHPCIPPPQSSAAVAAAPEDNKAIDGELCSRATAPPPTVVALAAAAVAGWRALVTTNVEHCRITRPNICETKNACA